MKIWSETASCFKMRKLSVLLKVSLENHDASKKKKSVEVGNFFFFFFFLFYQCAYFLCSDFNSGLKILVLIAKLILKFAELCLHLESDENRKDRCEVHGINVICWDGL